MDAPPGTPLPLSRISMKKIVSVISFKKSRTLMFLAIAGAFPLHTAMAQEAAATTEYKAPAGQLETVIVTAQRRS